MYYILIAQFKLIVIPHFIFQTEISKRLNAIIVQIIPFLQGEHQQQVLTAVDRAKQVTMTELNAVIGVNMSFKSHQIKYRHTQTHIHTHIHECIFPYTYMLFTRMRVHRVHALQL